MSPYFPTHAPTHGRSSKIEEAKPMLEAEEHVLYSTQSRYDSPFEWVLRLTCGLMFIAGFSMLVVALDHKQSDQSCTAQLSTWSPLLEAIEYEHRNWESIFAKTHSELIGKPTAELEARWESLVDVPTVLVPRDRIPNLNQSIEAGFVEAESAGQSGYVAGIEVFHQLHCLNVLRQALYIADYPPDLVPTLFKYNTPAAARKHVDHCIIALHQALTCNADITPYMLHTVPGKGAGSESGDFQSAHKCKNFDRIFNWIHANGEAISPQSLDQN